MDVDTHRTQPLRYAPEVDVTLAGELDVIEAKHAVRKHDGVPKEWLAPGNSPQRLALAVASEEQGARGNASSNERGKDEPGHVV
jgi:hypothetical protein